jgi:enolase-phosphatase E1
MKAILLDIEGTTTPIDFVHKTLFPYAKAKISAYVHANYDSLATEIAQIEFERAADENYPNRLEIASPNSITAYLEYLIDIDRKSTPLKTIQGKIWQEGYESGELLSEVFDDVPRAFKRWKDADKTIAIYSSGSVLAQQMLFRYTTHGDLTPFISNYFDTNTGHKRESASYSKIAEEINFSPGEISFISDITEELDAAAEAGIETLLSVRDGDAPVLSKVHRAVRNFDEV